MKESIKTFKLKISQAEEKHYQLLVKLDEPKPKAHKSHILKSENEELDALHKKLRRK